MWSYKQVQRIWSTLLNYSLGTFFLVIMALTLHIQLCQLSNIDGAGQFEVAHQFCHDVTHLLVPDDPGMSAKTMQLPKADGQAKEEKNRKKQARKKKRKI